MTTTSRVDLAGEPASFAAPRIGRLGRGLRASGSRIVLGALLPGALIAAWAVGASTGAIDPAVFSSPAAVAGTAASLWQQGLLQEHLSISLIRAGAGFGIGVGVGVLLGVLSGTVMSVERLIDPSLQILRAVPIVILLPLFVVWLGFGELPKILFIVLAIMPKVYVGTYAGIVNVDPRLLEVAQVFQLSRLRSVFGIAIPSASPYIFNAIRLATVNALIALIFAESLNAKSGLGYLSTQGLLYFRADLILVVALTYAALGLGADTLVRGIELAATPWKARGRRS